jgi:hypothetical protein
VVKFDEKEDATHTKSTSAASSTGTVNDLGQEETFYITFDAFINLILNNASTGMLRIVNDALDSNNQLDYLLYPITAGMGENEVPVVGYNKYLRSTDPSVMLIYNKDAVTDAQTTQGAVTKSLLNKLNTSIPIGEVTKDTPSGKALNTIRNTKIQRISGDFGESGLMFLSKGVWLNSKAIQQVFLSARTIMEGIEALLVKINAATEGYWNLKITYDDEKDCFRLIDDNAKRPPRGKQRIYTFNKKLPTSPSSPTNVTGPDVLDIKIASDYPKLIFSQLAISGVNNASGVPGKTDLNFQRPGLYGSRLKDFLIDEPVKSPQSGSGATTNISPSIDVFVSGDLQKSAASLKSKDQTDIFSSALLIGAFKDNFPIGVRSALTTIFSNGNKPISRAQANQFLNAINTSDLTPSQFDALATILKQRIRAIVTNSKNAELADLQNFWNTATGLKPTVVVTPVIEANKKLLLDAIEQAKPGPR